MNFQILLISGSGDLHEGQIVQYNITVPPFIRMLWESELTEIVEQKSFTNVQRIGPYAKWEHKHRFAGVKVALK